MRLLPWGGGALASLWNGDGMTGVILQSGLQHNAVGTYDQLAPVIPPGGDLRLFVEAANVAVNTASRYRVDGFSPYYNLYLTQAMKFEGYSANCLDAADSYVRRKQAFMKSRLAFWCVTFNRVTGRAVATCKLGGYRARFGKKNGPQEVVARPNISSLVPKGNPRDIWNPRWSRNGFGRNLSRAAVAARKEG